MPCIVGGEEEEEHGRSEKKRKDTALTPIFSVADIHDEIVVLFVQLAILLLTARVLGEVARRLGQPSVLGEILAGIVLGPSLLSGFVPGLAEWMLPQTATQAYLLELIALIGAMFMLLITGLEIDVNLIRQHARTAISTSAGGLLVPFSFGFTLALFLPDDLLANPDQRIVFALFFAIALSVAAIPVIAKVLMEMDALRRDVGQTIIASAMIDDITAWTMLSIVVGLAAGEAVTIGSVAFSIFKVVAFVVVSFTLGRWVVAKVLDFVQNEIKSPDAILSTVVILMFIWGAVSHALYLEAVIGAFAVGILFGQMPTLPAAVIHKLESIALGIFAPIFFAVAGLKVNLGALLDPRLFGFFLLVLFIACAGKFIGAYSGARFLGKRDHWTAMSFASALNARGAVEIIIATIGLSIGVLGQGMFSIIVMIAILTSLMAPIALRWAFRQVQPGEAELARLRHAELVKDSLIANAHRVLLPVRLREDDTTYTVQAIEARMLEQIGSQSKLNITLLCVVQAEEKTRAQEFLAKVARSFSKHTVARKVVTERPPVDAILVESRKDYDLMILGAPEKDSASDVVFTHMVDHLVRFASCPTMVIQGGEVADDWKPQRIMVPTNGSVAARRAAEVGFAMASHGRGEVHILNAVSPAQSVREVLLNHQIGISQQIVDELRITGDTLGVPTVAEVRVGDSLPQVILEAAQNEQIDLLIFGIDVRTGSRLYFGPLVEYVLQHATCPVLIVNAAYASTSSVVVVPGQTAQTAPVRGSGGAAAPAPAPAAPSSIAPSSEQ